MHACMHAGTITELRKACIHPQLTSYWTTLANDLQLGSAGALGPVDIMQRMLATGTRELQVCIIAGVDEEKIVFWDYFLGTCP